MRKVDRLDKLLAEGGRLLLLGNEAIARGLIEAGAGLAATYPGTPSSEVGGVLDDIAKDAGMYFEYSVNEKVAMEVAGAAAVSGVRSFVFMKHVGLNVASDAFMSLSYTGVRAGMVVMTADDPSCHSSQNEQDNRFYAKLGLVPMLEPSTPAECKDMVMEAFRVSEALGTPVLLRTTTRVNHARGAVELGTPALGKRKSVFEKDPRRFVTVPANARLGRVEQLKRMEKALEMAEASPLNFVDGSSDIGVIASGVAYTYAREWLDGVAVLKLGFSYPVPERMVLDFLRGKKTVVVLEELEPILEDEVRRIAQQSGINVEILGKRTGHLPRAFEYSPDLILALRSVLPVRKEKEPLPMPALKVPSRPPVLCAGCPHRATFYAAKKAVGREGAIYSTDIGCYTLGVQPPMRTADLTLCMGSSVGAANGFSEVTDQKVVGFIGDSTFFHGGIPGLINAVYNKHKFLLVILDNRTTAMTGHQPNPGTGRDYGGIESPPLPIEPLVRACGIQYVKTVDPYDLRTTTEAMKEALAFDGPSVVIAERACPLAMKKGGKLAPTIYEVDQEKCVHCYTCVAKFSCPALSKEGGDVKVDAASCIGCGGCAQVCPKNAIGVVQ
ncbi:indolepyruvate ferredoxin oxidoreductase subunit alpha [Methanomassiliicoccus luminyensis]|uniref:indolepyruvate ferredoxin oxidoreductase subunit alpha n=1 Tax=Methanomassiliicoccus luminyensis TaxID=1080712 RepID=UPI000AB3BEA1|nr:indolepyruvate ferredoxin oxidoreductase subunit alpha [Methanomassiliicoccus luminyensis]